MALSSADLDWNQLLVDRPDVLTEFNDESTRDRKSQNNLKNIGALTDTDFAQWWYEHYGKGEGYTQTKPPTTPVTPTDPTPGGPPNVTPDLPDFSGLISSLAGGFTNQVQKEQDYSKMREDARNSVYGALGLTSSEKIPNSSLDSTIQEILSGKSDDALKILDRGKARGQFTDAGYQKGLSSLANQKSEAQSKLNDAANGILSGYDLQLDSIRNNALSVANTITGGTPFSLDPFNAQMNDLLARMNSSAPGALRTAIGDSDLINLGDIRGDIATEQGTTNMRDLDLADALAKRKKVDDLGRGLGSQGTF